MPSKQEALDPIPRRAKKKNPRLFHVSFSYPRRLPGIGEDLCLSSQATLFSVQGTFLLSVPKGLLCPLIQVCIFLSHSSHPHCPERPFLPSIAAAVCSTPISLMVPTSSPAPSFQLQCCLSYVPNTGLLAAGLEFSGALGFGKLGREPHN